MLGRLEKTGLKLVASCFVIECVCNVYIGVFCQHLRNTRQT